MKNLYKLFLFVVLSTTLDKLDCYGMEAESVLDRPLIKPNLMTYYADKRPLRVEISIGDPSGRGERALDFFLVEGSQPVPTTLRTLLEKSTFIQTMMAKMFDTTDVLMISESVSGVEGEQKINGFIGINKTDVS